MPLMAAPLMVLVRRSSAAWVLAAAACAFSFARGAAALPRRCRARTDLLSHRQLGAALGHRVPGRRAERFRAGAGLGHGDRGGAVRLAQRRRRAAARPGLPVLHHVLPVPGRVARHDDHRRRVQPVRVHRDLLAVELRADRARARSPRAIRGLPVPRARHHRRHLLRDRHRDPVPRDRHAQHRRPGAAPAPGREPATGAGGPRVHHGRRVAQARALPRSTSGCRTPTPMRPRP